MNIRGPQASRGAYLAPRNLAVPNAKTRSRPHAHGRHIDLDGVGGLEVKPQHPGRSFAGKNCFWREHPRPRRESRPGIGPETLPAVQLESDPPPRLTPQRARRHPMPPCIGQREWSDLQLSWNVRSPGHVRQHAATPPARQPSLLTSAIPHVLRKESPSRRPDPHFLLKKCG